jgi:hypothetical protein
MWTKGDPVRNMDGTKQTGSDKHCFAFNIRARGKPVWVKMTGPSGTETHAEVPGKAVDSQHG